MARPSLQHPHIIGFPLSTNERNILEACCKHFGMSKAQLYRMMISELVLDPAITAAIAPLVGMEEQSLVALANATLGRHCKLIRPQHKGE